MSRNEEPRGHRFTRDLERCASAVCANGCGTIARKLKTQWGTFGAIEYFDGIEKTGPRATDNRGVWTTTEPPCKVAK